MSSGEPGARAEQRRDDGQRDRPACNATQRQERAAPAEQDGGGAVSRPQNNVPLHRGTSQQHRRRWANSDQTLYRLPLPDQMFHASAAQTLKS